MLWNKGGEAFCQRRHGGLAKTKTRTKSVSLYSCYLTLFFSAHHHHRHFRHLLHLLPRVCNQKINERRLCGKWPLSDRDVARITSVWLHSVSPVSTPGPPHRVEGKLFLCSTLRQHKQFITNELLLYLRMTHIKFWPINFEMDFWNGS